MAGPKNNCTSIVELTAGHKKWKCIKQNTVMTDCCC